MKRLFWTACAFAACSAPLAALAVDITSEWAVVAPKHEVGVISYGYERAAKLLRQDIAEGAGIDLEIVNEVPKTGPAICLGIDLAKAAGIATDGFEWFDNAIVEKGGRIYLFGNDRARNKNMPHGGERHEQQYRRQFSFFHEETIPVLFLRGR